MLRVIIYYITRVHPRPYIQGGGGYEKLAALVILLFCAGAFAQDLPRIAVYVTGDIGENEKKTLGTKMLSTLVNSGRYRGIERSNAFLAEIEKEHVRQRSGDIDDGQISELGKQFGVKFICIADLTPAFGAYQVSARIINVETAEVPYIGEASSPLKTMEDLEQVSVDVVRKMLFFAGESSDGTRSAQQPTVIVIQQGKQPKDMSMDFTDGQRWGTWALNFVPGLGSATIMKDYKGAGINAALGFGGYGVGASSTVVDDNISGILSITGLIIWIGCGSAWNIYRSITYHHPAAIKKNASNPLQGVNFAVLPDQDGNIKGYVAYRMEF